MFVTYINIVEQLIYLASIGIKKNEEIMNTFISLLHLYFKITNNSCMTHESPTIIIEL